MSRRTTRLTVLVVAVLAVVGLAAGALAGPARADQRPTVSAGDILVTESDTGTTAAVFTLTLTQPSPNKIAVSYATSDNSAKAPGDYLDAAGVVVFPAGALTRTVSIDVVGDTRYEGDEVFTLGISSASAGVSSNDATATIVDDDPQPYVSVDNTTVNEGNSGTVDAVFPIRLDRPSVNPVRVRYETGDGNAVGGFDYTRVRGTVTIPAGQTSGTVTVTVNGDTYDEGRSEYFYLYIGASSGAFNLTTEAIGVIQDDDGTVQLSLTDSAVVEGNSGTRNMAFKATLSGASSGTVIASYGTTDGSATANDDYVPTFGTITFAPGETSKTITVPVVGDTADEGNAQYFNAYLNNVSGAELVDGGAFGEIVDDDPTLSASSFLTVDSTSVTESDTGTVNLSYAVLLQPASASQVTVNYTTYDNTAVAGTDYVAKSGTLTFAPGQTRLTVPVQVKGDQLIEATEAVGLSLSGAVNATIDDSQAYGYVFDDDVLPVVAISDTTVSEGDTGTADAAFEITLSEPTNVVASVVYTTNNNGASAGSDYTAVSATAVFQPGETSQTIHVPVTGDTADENDEGFYVYLSSGSNAAVNSNYGYAVILDDDRNPTVKVADSAVFEGTDATVAGEFTVSLSAPSVNTVTVNYSTSNGNAVAPADYTPVNGTVTFAPGETEHAVLVPIVSDAIDENLEYLILYLGGAVNATIPDNDGFLHIYDDDTMPGISAAETSLLEPDTGSADMLVTVTLGQPTANVVTVNYSTSNGTAVAGSDYTQTNGTLTFNPGETSKDIAVPVLGDTIRENNEYFQVNLGGAANAYLRDSSTYGTIVDTDPASYVSTTDPGVNEGNSGSRNVVFTVTLSPPSVNTVTVNYGTLDGTATVAGGDYLATSGTLVFTPGQKTKTVPVKVFGDTVDENSEYFGLDLSGATNAGILDSRAYATIFDDDPTGGGSLISLDDVAVIEKNTGTSNATVTVTMSPAAASPVTVNYRTVDSGATADSDYVPQSDTLTFAPGETSKTITVAIKGDTLDEADEAIRIDLFGLTGPVTAGDTGTYVTILNDDRSPLLGIGDVTVEEGGAGRTVDAVFTVKLFQASPQPVTVDWDTRDWSAVAPGDYLDDSGTLSFAPGETSKTITITVNGDNVVEGDEGFYVDLSRSRGGSIASAGTTGVGVILDSDAYTVMGSVTTPTGAAVNGTTLTLAGNNEPTRTTTTVGGTFAFDDVPDGRYTLTPSAGARVFAPASYTVDVRGGSVTGQTFISLVKPSISGQVVDSTGRGVPGVTVTRTGNSQPTVTVTTNGQGWYGFSGNAAGSYTIKPTLSGSTFTPAQRTVTQTTTNTLTVNFTRN